MKKRFALIIVSPGLCDVLVDFYGEISRAFKENFFFLGGFWVSKSADS